MNDLMSGGMHRLWKGQFVRRVRPRKGEAILDMAGGTGDIAFRLAESGAHVTVADINPEMLAVGRALPPVAGAPIEWREGILGEVTVDVQAALAPYTDSGGLHFPQVAHHVLAVAG